MNKEKYFDYLAVLVDSDGHGHYNFLLEQLHSIVFDDSTAVLIPNDINRIEDGLCLREKYCHRHRVKFSDLILEEPCTLLEMMIGLALRIHESFGIKKTSDWFWELIGNLNLTQFDDETYEVDENASKKVDRIASRLLGRKYHHNGNGGLFPLVYPDRDQKTIEIWYQMNAYLNENY